MGVPPHWGVISTFNRVYGINLAFNLFLSALRYFEAIFCFLLLSAYRSASTQALLSNILLRGVSVSQLTLLREGGLAFTDHSCFSQAPFCYRGKPFFADCDDDCHIRITCDSFNS